MTTITRTPADALRRVKQLRPELDLRTLRARSLRLSRRPPAPPAPVGAADFEDLTLIRLNREIGCTTLWIGEDSQALSVVTAFNIANLLVRNLGVTTRAEVVRLASELGTHALVRALVANQSIKRGQFVAWFASKSR